MFARGVLDSYENLKKLKDYYVVRYFQELNPGEVAGGFGIIVSSTLAHLYLISLQMDAPTLLVCSYPSSELLLRLRDYQMIRKCARPEPERRGVYFQKFDPPLFAGLSLPRTEIRQNPMKE